MLEHPKQGEEIQSYQEDIIAVTDPKISDLNTPKGHPHSIVFGSESCSTVIEIRDAVDHRLLEASALGDERGSLNRSYRFFIISIRRRRIIGYVYSLLGFTVQTFAPNAGARLSNTQIT